VETNKKKGSGKTAKTKPKENWMTSMTTADLRERGGGQNREKNKKAN